MTKAIVQQSIFDGISKLDKNSQEYFQARDYAHKLGFDESYFLSISNIERIVYLLDLSVWLTQEPHYTAGSEAHWICFCTLLIPRNVPLDSLFNTAFSAINATLLAMTHEPHLHQVFKKHFKKWLVGYDLATRQNNPKHIPDFWLVSIKSQKLTPVEIKAHPFDNSAVTQLKRYMKEYKCHQGIAVAPSCKASLPNNIQFVKLDKAILDNLHPEIVPLENLKAYFHDLVVTAIHLGAEKELAKLKEEVELRKKYLNLLRRETSISDS